MEVLRGDARLLSLQGVGAGEERALRALARGGGTSDSLADLALEAGGAPALARWYYHLERLLLLGAVRYSLLQDERPILHIDVIAPAGSAGPPGDTWAGLVPGAGTDHARGGGTDPPPGERARGDPEVQKLLVLSRFATLRRLGSDMVLESPRSGVRFTLADPEALGLLHRISEPSPPSGIRSAVPGWRDSTLGTVLGLLIASQAVVSVDESGVPEEDRTPALRMWEAEDLRFHAHSRLGHHDRPVGGTFPFAGELPPLPALRPPRGTRVVELPEVDPARIEAEDPTLFRAMEMRRSRRPPFSRAIALEELSTLLWRTARVVQARPREKTAYEVRSRPHPGGGAAYPLEWYVAHRSLEEVEPGLHHYLPERHALEEVPVPEGAVDALFAGYRIPLDEGPQQPPILIVLTARFGRMSWKYQSVAYSLILKEVGVVFQSLYLVASAMGLEACALGAGDDLLFGRLAGLDPLVEASVGEFILGAHSGPPPRGDGPSAG